MGIKYLLPAPYPTTPPSGQQAIDEAAAAARADLANQVAAQDYRNATIGGYRDGVLTGQFLPQYLQGSILPYDAMPPAPPVKKWARVTTTELPGGALEIQDELLDMPGNIPVCAPFEFGVAFDGVIYYRLPKPQNGSVSLMQKLVEEQSKPSFPTIVTVPVGSMQTDSAGNTWFRTS